MEQNPSKYLHFKSARVHQENGWRNTNEERREMRSNVVGGLSIRVTYLAGRLTIDPLHH
jgi:hypothetical protein